MNNYGFILEFNELSEELQEQKIDEYMTYLYENDEEYYKEGEGFESLGDYLEDGKARDNARTQIEARFPMYF